jgi:hypothetical protein
MRQILVNYAERRRAQKRGGYAVLIPLEVANPAAPEAAEELLSLNEALERLAAIDERRHRVADRLSTISPSEPSPVSTSTRRPLPT